MDYNAPMLENVFGISWLNFNMANVLMMAIASLIVFVLCVLGSRSLQMKPTGAQNLMEWVLDFVKGMVNDTMDWKQGKLFLPLGLTLLTYILVSNLLGVITVIAFGPNLWWKSPTSDPGITLALATMVILLSHYYAVKLRGFKKYQASYFKPYPIFLPLNLISEFSNTLTLGLRLFGNVFAGGILLGMLVSLARTDVFGFIGAIVPMLAWQGFSVFVSGIQAFIFTVLALVYISQKVSADEELEN